MHSASASLFSPASVGYDANQHQLQLEFRDGKIYQFREGPPSEFAALMQSADKAGYIEKRISHSYPHRRLS